MGGQNRPGQHEMARQVVESLDSGRHLLVQAGTGTGKSLAYLVPAIAHALEAEKPVVVSTATLALQAQIVGRDVPRLLEQLAPHLPRKLDVALAKGRGNYVCRYKLGGGYPDEDEGALFALTEDGAARALTAGAGPSSALGQEVVRLREWAEETDTGDRDDLVPGVGDRAWRQVSVTAMDCLGAQKCPMAEECFSELARKKAAEADIVITNHAMLAVSAFEGIAVLPEFDTVVIDEAHELQDRVTGSVTRPLSVALVSGAASAARKHCHVNVDALNLASRALQKSLEWIPAGLMPSGLNEAQAAAVDQVREAARVALSDSKPAPQEAVDGGRQMARSQLLYLVEQCDRLDGAAEAREVVWASRPGQFTPGEGYVQPDDSTPATLNVAPLSVAGRLREGLFDGRTVVLTSATLAVGAAFEPVAGALGLLGPGAPAWTGVDVGSPFDYPRQGMLYVARHLPKPSRNVSTEALAELEDLIRAARGGALALFSSRRAAEEAAEALRPRLDQTILCQGDSSMASLVKEFADDLDTCLFGTMTLWQGVDVPGPACRLVVIDRIPFPRPDDPLSTARSRDVARHGGNGFMAVSASHAAVRLAQGAGRLIRSTSDRGVVAVLDSRLATERYGNFLRAALPPMWATTDKATVVGALERLAPARTP
ncbi:MAG: ATP-dependent DNA helicase [Arthrobacter sp.]|uniref:ATP-dependent DNA helicase n=1 Tax=Arthrobacter sp. TaxID=1667 RepID=UPI003481083A